MIAYSAPSIRKGPDLGAAEPTAPQYSWADADLRRRRPGASAEPYFAGSALPPIRASCCCSALATMDPATRPATVERRWGGVEVERVGGNRERRGQVLQEHPPGVAVGGDGVDRQVALGVGEGREVGLQTNSQGVHSISLSEMGSSLPAARAMSSPVAVRYQ